MFVPFLRKTETRVQAGLFSAAVTAFNIETYKNLQQDSGDLTSNILLHISQQLADNSVSTSNASRQSYTPPVFQPSRAAVRLNIFWFASLVFSLVAAFLAILVKQWLRQYTAGRYSNPEEFIRVRHCRREGLRRWRVFEIIGVLPLLLHTALILFFIGLADFLIALDKVVGIIVTIPIAGWLLLWFACTVTPFVSADCPYVTPLTRNGIWRPMKRSTWQLWSKIVEYSTGVPLKLPKYYSFPGDEMGLRRDTDLDLPALVNLDHLFMDDAFVDEVIRFCLRRMDIKDTLTFVRHFLKHRRAIFNFEPYALSHTDFTRISTRALVTTTEILHFSLEQVMQSHTSAWDVLRPWSIQSMDYIFAAVQHCTDLPRAFGPSMVTDTSQLLTFLFYGGRQAGTKLVIFLSRYPALMDYLILMNAPAEREYIVNRIHGLRLLSDIKIPFRYSEFPGESAGGHG